MERKSQELSRNVKLLWFETKKIHSFGQILSAIPGVILGTQSFIMELLSDIGIFSLKMEILGNKEEPAESICWRAQGQEEEMEKILK